MKSSNRIYGATILITGANGGMGKKTIEQLLLHLPKRIVLACRTEAKAVDTQQALGRNHDGPVQLVPQGGFDMGSESAIQAAVEALPAGQMFDIVFLQAGGVIFTDEYQFVQHQGRPLERTVFQNAIGGYLTLKHLEARGLLAPNARIVFAGGEGARGIPGLIDKPEFANIEELKAYLANGTPTYNPMNAIGVSKLVSALLCMKMAEVDPQREYVWFSPGLTGGTNGLDAMKGIKKYLMKYLLFPIFTLLGQAQPPTKAAAKYVRSLSGEIGKSGEVIGAPEGKALGKLVDQKPMNPAFTNQHFRNGLYEFVVEQFGPILPSLSSSISNQL